MMRYLILNTFWIVLAWVGANRLNYKHDQSVLILSFIVLYVMMVIFNTYLTSLPIVEYNPAYNLGFKILSWPIEDIGYLVVAVFLAPALYTTFLEYYDTHYESTPKPSQHTAKSSTTSSPRTSTKSNKKVRSRRRS